MSLSVYLIWKISILYIEDGKANSYSEEDKLKKNEFLHLDMYLQGSLYEYENFGFVWTGVAHYFGARYFHSIRFTPSTRDD